MTRPTRQSKRERTKKMPTFDALCHDCGVEEGCLHEFECDMETCPRCLGQLISCSCFADLRELEQEGRIPWIRIPNLCRLCGEQWPEFFTVADEEWKAIVPPNLQNELLCKPCYKSLKLLWKKRGRRGWQDKRISSKAGGDTNTTS